MQNYIKTKYFNANIIQDKDAERDMIWFES